MDCSFTLISVEQRKYEMQRALDFLKNFLHVQLELWRQGDVVVVASQQEGPGFKSTLCCMFSPACVGFLQVPWFLSTAQRHMDSVNWPL